jgi:uncharacterized phiE125 gp8 family phage protein
MTIAEMRSLVGLPEDATDAEVVAAYVALVDDGIPASIAPIEPVTVEMVRLQCRIEVSIEDDLIAQKIRSAREWVEDYTGCILAQQTLVAHFRTFGRYLEILKRPVISIDAILYNGPEGDGIYGGAASALGARTVRIYPSAAGWPLLRLGGGVTVAYTAGYDPGEVPYRLIEAILVLVAGMLGDREGAYEKSIAAAKSMCRRKPSTV